MWLRLWHWCVSFYFAAISCTATNTATTAAAVALNASLTRRLRKPAACRRAAKKKNPTTNANAVMQHSRAITKKSASNLALAFILLPRPKRDAMSALYAFCREVDDVADNESVPTEKRREQLADWRADVKRACENQPPQFPVNRELQPVIQQFHAAV